MMVAGKSKELPPGWKEFVRERNGRKIKYYSVAEDGKKFYSKQAVMRYVNVKIDANSIQPQTETSSNNIPQPQSEMDCNGTPQPRTETSCHSTPQPQSEMDCNNTAHQRNEHGEGGSKSVAGKVKEELPPGWKEFVRERNGRKIKYFSVAEDGKKFYSKQAVLRYVNAEISGNGTQPQTETGCSNIPPPQSEIDCSVTPRPQTETGCNNTPQPQSEIDHNDTPQPPTETGCNNTPQPHREMDCSITPQPQTEKDCNNTPHQQNEHGEGGSKGVDSGSAKTSKQLAWLPPGWITQVNSKKSGATYKIYIDPATGAKFYSKPQVLQYLGTVSLGDTVKENKDTVIGKPSSEGEVCEHKGLGKSQSCASETEMSNGNGIGNGNGNIYSTPIACSNATEVGSVDGLPNGWSKEIRTKEIAGKIIKDVYYNDPVSGFAFRSKKDALRYVETGDFSKCKVKPKKIEPTNIQSTEAGDFSNCNVEPKKMEATNIGSADAHTPFDKNDIYLEKIDILEHYTLGKSQNSLSREEEINKLFEDTVEAVKSVESTAIDGLPPGWIKEFKARKIGKRKDTFYVDPISGYMFWSKLDALRYIETGDIKKCAIKPKKRGADDNGSTQDVYLLPSPVGQRYSLQSTSGQLLISDDLNYGTQNFDTSNLRIEAESSKGMQEDGSSITGLTNNVAEVTPKKSLRKKERKPRKSPQISEIRPEGSEQEVRTASSTGTVVLDKQEFATSITKQKTETPASRSDTKRLSQSVPGRTSKRLAGTRPETPPNLQSSGRSLRSTTRKSLVGDVNVLPTMTIDAVASVPVQPVHSKPELSSADTSHEPDRDKQKHVGSSQKMDQGVHGRASKRLAGCQPEMPSNLQLSERSIRAAIRMACEDETTILPMITPNAVPSVKLQPQLQPFHPNLPVLDAKASHEQKLPNDDIQQKDGNNTPAGLKNSNKRKAENNSGRTSKRPAAPSEPRRTSKKPVAATSVRSSKRLTGSQLEPSTVTSTNSVPSALPQPPQSKPLTGTTFGKFSEGGPPTFPIDIKHDFGGTKEPLNTERTPDVADIVSMVVESISKMDEIEMNEQPLVSDHSVSGMKTGSKCTEASVEIKTVSASTGIQLNEKPEFENSKPTHPQGSYLSVVDSWSDSDPCLDFAFKTLTGAISLEDTLSYQGCSQPQDNTYSVHANGQFQQSGSQNLVNSQQNIPSQFQGTLAYHGSSQAQNTPSVLGRSGSFGSSQAQNTPSVLGRSGSFGQSGTPNHANFQQYTSTSFTSSWQHVQAEKPRNPSIPPGFDGVPPYRGIRNNSDTRNKDNTSYPGTNK